MANPSLPPFRNEPFTDFSTAENKRAMHAALDRARAELGQTYDLIIRSEEHTSELQSL